MNKHTGTMTIRFFLIILCFAMAVLSFLGVGTMDEPNGRLIFGLLWICVGILSIIRYLMERRKEDRRNEKS